MNILLFIIGLVLGFFIPLLVGFFMVKRKNKKMEKEIIDQYINNFYDFTEENKNV